MPSQEDAEIEMSEQAGRIRQLPQKSGRKPKPVRKEKHLTSRRTSVASPSMSLFGPYLKGANAIVVTDPYIRLFYQVRNLMELLETIARHKAG